MLEKHDQRKLDDHYDSNEVSLISEQYEKILSFSQEWEIKRTFTVMSKGEDSTELMRINK